MCDGDDFLQEENMRRLLIGLVVTATTVIVPALAWAGNQETADQIMRGLNGNLRGQNIAIRVESGTAVLSGYVQNQAQMDTALKIASQTPGVTRVVNDMAVAGAPQSEPTGSLAHQETAPSKANANNPLRKGSKANLANRLQSSREDSDRVEPVSSTFGGNSIETVSAEEAMNEPNTFSPQQRGRMMQQQGNPQQMAMMQQQANQQQMAMMQQRAPMGYNNNGAPMPMNAAAAPAGASPVRYDQPHMPNYAWPSYASYPNYAAVTYPKQYSPTVWPYIGPFYPYPQVPMGWRKVSLEWSDGWWFLDFKDQPASCWQR
jgi:hypothetical protein